MTTNVYKIDVLYKTCTLLCSLEVQHMFIIVVVKDLLLPPEAALCTLLSLDLPGLPGVPPDLRGQVRLRLPALLLEPLIIHTVLESSPLLR